MNLIILNKIVIFIVLISLICANTSTLFISHNNAEMNAIEIIDMDDKESDQEEKEEKEKENKIVTEFNFIDYKYSIDQSKGKKLNCKQAILFIEIFTPPPEQIL